MGRGQGTALTGGWAKIGNCAHDLLSATIAWICESERLDPVDELRRASSSERKLADASFLTLGKIFRAIAKYPSAQVVAVHRITHDVGARASMFAEIAKTRAARVHEREDEVQVAADLRLLRRFDRFLQEVRADLTGAS
ncbi:MAG: hypothetical protein ACHREM_01665 [Polyangiales bacterium]